MEYLRTRQLDWRGHLLLIHNTEQERRAEVAAWVQRGLDLGERVVYIEPPGVPVSRSLGAVLAEQRVPLDGAVDRGQLRIVVADHDVYSPDGLSALVDQALAQGYPRVRMSGEAETAHEVMSPMEHLEFERATDQLCRTSPVSVLCQYSADLTRGALSGVTETHQDGVRERLLQTARQPEGILLAGEVDISNHNLLHYTLQAASSAAADPFVVDLGLLRFVDVKGARALLAGTRGYRQEGGHVRLHAPQPMVNRMLQLCGVERTGGLQVDRS